MAKFVVLLSPSNINPNLIPMKKLYIFLIAVVLTSSLLAQQTATNETFHFDGYAAVDYHTLLQKHHLRATKELPIGWMVPSWNLLDYYYVSNSMVTHYANLIFPDSTVVYESGGVTLHNWLNSVGGVFDPYSPMFDTMQVAPLLPLTDPYRIDSIFLLACQEDRVVSYFVTHEDSKKEKKG